MDAIDLKRGNYCMNKLFVKKTFLLIAALDIIQEDYKTERKNIQEQLSLQLYPDYHLSDTVSKNLKAEPQQASKGFGKLIALVKSTKAMPQSSVTT